MNIIQKLFSLLIASLTFTAVYGQEFKWTEKGNNSLVVQIDNYDEIGYSLSTSPLNNFYYDISRFKPGVFNLKVVNGSGKTMREATVKDGKMGKETWWYSDGTKQWEADWGYSDLIVSKTKYYRNGQKELETKQDGKTTVWYNNGNIRIEQTIIKGMRDKMYRQFYENGQLTQEGLYEKGVKKGEWKFYTEDGKLMGVKDYN